MGSSSFAAGTSSDARTLPFLKWPGGKRWAAARISALITPYLSGTYYEPFLGSGAVFFHLRPASAILSDINQELIGTYIAVQQNAHGIVRRLKSMRVSKRNYYQVRSRIPRGRLNQAARFLYMNRTAFGGIYRLNRRGEFNVPYGGGERTPKLLWKEDILLDASKALDGVKLAQSDFEPVLDIAQSGDAVYCDPTYTVTHDVNGFVRYNEKNFAWSDQQRLAAAARRAAARGALVIVSNAHHPTVKALYKDAEVQVLERKSLVSSDPINRRPVREYVFVLRSSRWE